MTRKNAPSGPTLRAEAKSPEHIKVGATSGDVERLTRDEYEERRLGFTKYFLRYALKKREEMFGKITDDRLMIDFIWRGVFCAAKIWDEELASHRIEVAPDARTPEDILRDVAARLAADGADKREAEL